jgi:hypothetical protein
MAPTTLIEEDAIDAGTSTVVESRYESDAFGSGLTRLAEDEAAAAALPECGTVNEFVSAVIYDGRFIDEIKDAEAVARKLGMRLAKPVADELRDREPSDVLAEVTKGMTHDLGQRMVRCATTAPMPVADIGTSVAVAVGVSIVVTVVAVVVNKTTDGDETCVDRSPNAGDKL